MNEEQLDRLRKLAGTSALLVIQYLDADGNPEARGEQLKTVRLVFDTGEHVDIDPSELGKVRRTISFTMAKEIKQ